MNSISFEWKLGLLGFLLVAPQEGFWCIRNRSGFMVSEVGSLGSFMDSHGSLLWQDQASLVPAHHGWYSRRCSQLTRMPSAILAVMDQPHSPPSAWIACLCTLPVTEPLWQGLFSFYKDPMEGMKMPWKGLTGSQGHTIFLQVMSECVAPFHPAVSSHCLQPLQSIKLSWALT